MSRMIAWSRSSRRSLQRPRNLVNAAVQGLCTARSGQGSPLELAVARQPLQVGPLESKARLVVVGVRRGRPGRRFLRYLPGTWGRRFAQDYPQHQLKNLLWVSFQMQQCSGNV